MAFMSAHPPTLEIGQNKLFLRDRSEGLQLDLERDPNRRLSRDCMARTTAALAEWARSHGWEPGRPVWCAIGGRGVSLRRLDLPSTVGQNLESVIALQVESEFPVPPADLAWGYQSIHAAPDVAKSTTLVVGAIRIELLQDINELCAGAGFRPVVTLASLACSALCASPPDRYGILCIDSQQSELLTFLGGAPESVRVLRWGRVDLERSIASELGMATEQAMLLLQSPSTPPARLEALRLGFQNALRPLHDQLQPAWLGRALFVCGDIPAQPGFEQHLVPSGDPDLRTERLPVPVGPGCTAAIQGILEWPSRFPESALLQFQSRGQPNPVPVRRPSPLKWMVIAAILLLGLLSLRYLEPILGKPRLARRIALIEARKAQLPGIDQELAFLEYLQRSQPPFLEAVALLAQSASPGLRLDSLTLNRRGEVAFRGVLANAAQAVDLRLKLIDSGFFSSVVVEEQTPTPDRNQMIVRMSAHWKAHADRKSAGFRPADAGKPPGRNPADGVGSGSPGPGSAPASASSTVGSVKP